MPDSANSGGIWAQDPGGTWRVLPAAGFASEKDLHDLVELTPSMLPISGAPRLAILGREVQCGTGRADLIGVEVTTGRPVVIEIKLAANTDRRQVVTQVLGYAAYLRRLDAEGFADLIQQHLAKRQIASIGEAAGQAAEDPAFDMSEFQAALAGALEDGRLRCVVVLDSAPNDLVELVGYLQEVTNDRLSLDLVTVTSYSVADQQIMVPQLVEPDRSQVTARSAGSSKPTAQARPVVGSHIFEESIDQARPEHRGELRRLLEWARELENDGLTKLYTSTGKGRWVLSLRVPGQERAMTVIWNEGGASLSPYRTVLAQEAPRSLKQLDEAFPGQVGQGNVIRSPNMEAMLVPLRCAYVEANESAHAR